jgi:hypothetical protein
LTFHDDDEEEEDHDIVNLKKIYQHGAKKFGFAFTFTVTD